MARSGPLLTLLLLFLWMYGGKHLSAQPHSPPGHDTTTPQFYPSSPLPLSPPVPLPVSWINSPSPVLQHFADSSLRPFYHGIASGDPLPDRIIIWTRVTPDHHAPVEVTWKVALDSSMKEIMGEGRVLTDASRDYTVKVDVPHLDPGTLYFYQFTALGRNSVTGRLKTAPTGYVDNLRFAVASCANYQHGYFNAYRCIADRDDLDGVLFLGDYLYEDGVSTDDYGPIQKRLHQPPQELRTLEEYRKRHAFYKLDPDLRYLHTRHPFIAIWDDHEMSDDCYTDGALGTSGSLWDRQKSEALQAYFEWMPVREPEGEENHHIFRSFRYGNLAEIIMLDTRQEGRVEQVESSDDPHLFDTERSMLGAEQLRWFLRTLDESDAQWKLIGNQVVMSQIRGIRNLDAWDGYPAERHRILEWIRKKQIRNVLFLTGDAHISIASDICPDPFNRNDYDGSTGNGSIGVEFTTPSITSANMNELLHLPPRNYKTILAEQGLFLLNPHVKMADLDNHGYFILDLNSERAEADWYFVKTLSERNPGEGWGSSWKVRDGRGKLERASSPLIVTPNIPSRGKKEKGRKDEDVHQEFLSNQQ